jgi:hypothetical protein
VSRPGARPAAIAKATKSLVQGAKPTLRLKLSTKAVARAVHKHNKVTAKIT